jgi:hypothetical protein
MGQPANNATIAGRTLARESPLKAKNRTPSMVPWSQSGRQRVRAADANAGCEGRGSSCRMPRGVVWRKVQGLIKGQ